MLLEILKISLFVASYKYSQFFPFSFFNSIKHRRGRRKKYKSTINALIKLHSWWQSKRKINNLNIYIYNWKKLKKSREIRKQFNKLDKNSKYLLFHKNYCLSSKVLFREDRWILPTSQKPFKNICEHWN